MPFQLAFAVDETKRMVSEKPALKDDPMVAALLAGDTATLLAGPNHEGLLRIIALTHAGMTTDEFAARVNDWVGTAKHPKFDRPYDQLTYQPMQEVLRYLRASCPALLLKKRGDTGDGADQPASPLRTRPFFSMSATIWSRSLSCSSRSAKSSSIPINHPIGHIPWTFAQGAFSVRPRPFLLLVRQMGSL